MSEYYKKYIKYKNKYINLQTQIGSGKYTGVDRRSPYPAILTPDPFSSPAPSAPFSSCASCAFCAPCASCAPSASPIIPEPIRYPDDNDFTFFQRMGDARDKFIFNPDKIIKEYGHPFHDSAYYPSEMPNREWRDSFIKDAYEAYESMQKEREEESIENAIKEKKEKEIQLEIKRILRKI